MNFKIGFIFFALSFMLITSCTKENIDTTTTEEENGTETILCNLDLDITETSPGFLTANVDGGTAPYIYEWSTGETSNSIEVPNGTYSVIVIDVDGCTIEQSITVTASGGGNGCQDFWIDMGAAGPNVVTVYAGGGIEPYDITWSNGDIATGLTEHSIMATPGETYSVTVIDANGCSETATITAPNVSDPCGGFQMSVEESIPNSGLLYMSTFGGTTPFDYLWSTGETTSSIAVLDAGTYSATIVDGNGCTVEESITISQPDPCASLILELSPADPTNDEMTVYVYGGTPGYAYQWSTGETTNIISIVAGNSYSVTVTDSFGCVVTGSIQL